MYNEKNEITKNVAFLVLKKILSLVILIGRIEIRNFRSVRSLFFVPPGLPPTKLRYF